MEVFLTIINFDNFSAENFEKLTKSTLKGAKYKVLKTQEDKVHFH